MNEPDTNPAAPNAVFAQGDILFVRRAIPAEAKQAPAGRITLALGEATGHAHVIDDETVTAYTMADAANEVRTFLRVASEAGTTVKHVHGESPTGEHDNVHLPPGEWERLNQAVWTGEDASRAAD